MPRRKFPAPFRKEWVTFDWAAWAFENSREAVFSLGHLTDAPTQLPILISLGEQQFTASRRSQIGAVMNYCNCLFYTLQ